MDVRFINPFITATTNALQTMAGLEVTRGSPFVKGGFQALADVSGIIGLAGEAKGAVVVSFPFSLAKRIYEAMTGEAVAHGHPGIADAVGEIANMVAGGAKGALTEQGMNFRISVPSVVMGKEHTISHKSDAPCLIIPFQLGTDTFWLQVSIKLMPDGSG
ncbi:MAG: chemotaxis protein CheX [Deltaproteobacteria bacterium]|nr:chemotaxis protein CheX [Deltaproteobacteria bacterium]